MRNNAGEISDGSDDCSAWVFYSKNFSGPSNYVLPGWGGNLNASLVNNEASVQVLC